jgi:hypothetical protein
MGSARYLACRVFAKFLSTRLDPPFALVAEAVAGFPDIIELAGKLRVTTAPGAMTQRVPRTN